MKYLPSPLSVPLDKGSAVSRNEIGAGIIFPFRIGSNPPTKPSKPTDAD